MNANALLQKPAVAVATLIVGTLFLAPQTWAEQSPSAPEASPDVYKVLAENDQMRVIEATWAPGQQDKPHSHLADRASIYLTDCKLRLFKPNGGHKDAAPKGGTAKVRSNKPVGSHWVKNTGEETCKIILVELKK